MSQHLITRQRSTVRDLKAQSEFYESQLARHSLPPVGECESWWASLPAVGTDAEVAARAVWAGEWLLDAGCEDCVPDLAASSAGLRRLPQ